MDTEGTLEIRDMKLRTRKFTTGAFAGQTAVEAPCGPMQPDGTRELVWVPESEVRQRMAVVDRDLRFALDCLLDGLAIGYGMSRGAGASIIRMVLMEPSHEAMVAPEVVGAPADPQQAFASIQALGSAGNER